MSKWKSQISALVVSALTHQPDYGELVKTQIAFEAVGKGLSVINFSMVMGRECKHCTILDTQRKFAAWIVAGLAAERVSPPSHCVTKPLMLLIGRESNLDLVIQSGVQHTTDRHWNRFVGYYPSSGSGTVKYGPPKIVTTSPSPKIVATFPYMRSPSEFRSKTPRLRRLSHHQRLWQLSLT